MSKKITLLLAIIFFYACSDSSKHANVEPNPIDPVDNQVKELVIYFVNDQHGQINNFSKIKHIVDAQKELTETLLVCSGDMFSGNAVVDFHEKKGFPMIDIMNQTGFDLAVLGNHEFDYGEMILKDRMAEANFDWVCANVDMKESGIQQPDAFKTLEVGDLKVTFLGLVETFGQSGAVIPSTHPWRVQNLSFEHYFNKAEQYRTTKSDEGSDLYVALTHLGRTNDFRLAEDFPFFDLIIGGHSHREVAQEVNGIPVFQAGSYLNKLGKISLKIKDKKIQEYDYELINLNNYLYSDSTLETAIEQYNDNPALNEEIGTALSYHNRAAVGCFITGALTELYQADMAIQNSGGIRNVIYEGSIKSKDIYAVNPFNNDILIYELTVAEMIQIIKNLNESFNYGGLQIVKNNNTVELYKNNRLMASSERIKLVIGDYVPAKYPNLFPNQYSTSAYNDAASLIQYLKTINDVVNVPDCNQYFDAN